jgi:hypothetical protein
MLYVVERWRQLSDNSWVFQCFDVYQNEKTARRIAKMFHDADKEWFPTRTPRKVKRSEVSTFLRAARKIKVTLSLYPDFSMGCWGVNFLEGRN